MRFNTIFVLVVLFLFYLLVPVLALFFVKNDKKYRLFKCIFLSLFFIVLFIGVLGNIDITNKVVYIGWEFSGEFFAKDIIFTFPKFKLDIFINIFMLLPIGEIIFIEKIKKYKNSTAFDAFFIGIVIGLVIEFCQFMLPIERLVQISDIVYNGISSLVGYIYISIIYYININILSFFKRFKKSTNIDK